MSSAWIDRLRVAARDMTELWESRGSKISEFAFTALETAKKHRLHEAFSLSDVAALLSDGRELPAQARIGAYADFADPSITIYRDPDERFLFEINIWWATDTIIHDHSTEGANFLLLGQNYHSQYEFEGTLRDHCPGVLEGNLRLKGATVQRAGEGYEIGRGLAFIHRLHHIELPSVSLVIRRLETPRSPNRVYLSRKLAVLASLQADRLARKRMALFDYHRSTQDPYAETVLRESLVERHGSAAIYAMMLLFDKGVPWEEVAAAVRLEGAGWQELLRGFWTHIQFENVRMDPRKVTEPLGRSLLSALQTLPYAPEKNLLIAIGQIYPERDALSTMESGVAELIRLGALHPEMAQDLLR